METWHFMNVSIIVLIFSMQGHLLTDGCNDAREIDRVCE